MKHSRQQNYLSHGIFLPRWRIFSVPRPFLGEDRSPFPLNFPVAPLHLDLQFHAPLLFPVFPFPSSFSFTAIFARCNIFQWDLSPRHSSMPDLPSVFNWLSATNRSLLFGNEKRSLTLNKRCPACHQLRLVKRKSSFAGKPLADSN